MQAMLYHYILVVVFAPLIGSLIAGFLGKKIGPSGAHTVTIILMLVSFLSALRIFVAIIYQQADPLDVVLYHWATSGSFQFNIAFYVDQLAAYMLMVVTFVSLLVHVYSIGYMHDDPGYQRFFCYMSLFTFAMLMLVTANDFLQLFFGWEGVGLVSYLLIGFYFSKPSAAIGSYKAFVVNRIGDFGFIIAIGAIIATFGSVDFNAIFSQATQSVTSSPGVVSTIHHSTITLICILLFVGAMGKSAQIPLHVWLPESMEGPTPISALIHAATMVTAGVYLIARMSPLYELSVPALSLVLIIGATGALFLGILAFVATDIKQVIAFSTMSQLGYMMAGNGASAFSAGIFHLSMHACFKALLFLCAGSVIVAMHHEQDLRKMGGLRKYLPVTYVCFFIGAAALSAIPPFAGYYSKDAIIEAVHHSTIPGATYAYYCVLLGAFVTGFYIFRAFFMAFHGPERFDPALRSHLREYWSMRIPLILLSIASVVLGFLLVGWVVYSQPGLFGQSITVAPKLNVLAEMSAGYKGAWPLTWHAVETWPFWLSLAGIISAWVVVMKPSRFMSYCFARCEWLRFVLVNQYGFDFFNKSIISRGSLFVSRFFYKCIDLVVIDDFFVNGSGRYFTRISAIFRRLQTGLLYHYIFVMILFVLIFSSWMVFF